jgi:hypothetical protein
MEKQEYPCKHCHKNFKKSVIRDKHEYEQVCIPVSRRTYCKLCDVTAESMNMFNEHLISRSHLDKVGRISVDNLNMVIVNPVREKMNKMAEYDPILAQCGGVTEVAKETLNVFHKDGSISRVDTDGDSSLHELSLSDVDKAVRDVEVANAGIVCYQELVERERGMAKITGRQQRIMEYLCRFQDSEPKEMIERFKVILDKIGMADADFLATHIRNNTGLSLEAKQIYGGYLEKFVNVLTRRVMNGEKLYRDMDIFEFVAKLTK